VLLLIDNYDSFTFNLVHALETLGETVRVARHDAIDVDAIERMAPAALLVSPGPGGPDEAGVSVAAIRTSLGRRPILGVCLGHQALGAALGARVVRARRLVHGKAERIEHDGRPPFDGLPSPVAVARYHSLALDESSLPAELEVAARAADGEVMAIRHRRHAAVGVQFHPESFLTPLGGDLLAGFLRLAGARR